MLRTLFHILSLPRFFPAALASLLSSLFSILLMGASSWIIASAALAPPLASLALAITLVRACGLFRAVFRYLDRYLSHEATFAVLTRLRLRVYQKAISLLPLSDTPTSQGAFLHDLTFGVDVLRDFYLRAIAPPLLALLLSIVAFLFLHPLSAIAAYLPLLAFLLSILIPTLTHLFYSTRESEEHADMAYRDVLIDAQRGLPELLTSTTKDAIPDKHARLDTFLQRLDKAALRKGREETRRRLLERYGDTLVRIFLRLTFVAIFALLVHASIRSDVGLNGVWLAVYVLSIETLLQEFVPIPEAVRVFFKTKHVARRILDMPTPYKSASPSAVTPSMPRDERADDPSAKTPKTPSPSLQVKGLTFYYPEQKEPTIDNLSFTVQNGEHVALVGESGKGKTTLFHLLLRLYTPQKGVIKVEGTPYVHLSAEKTREYFAAATQAGYLFSSSLRDNFRYLHPAISDEEIYRALDKAAFSSTLAELPQGLDTPLGEDGANLSGGQRQRLLVALALARADRPILLLDEPTAGLDRHTADTLLSSIEEESKDRTLLLITHDTEGRTRLSRTIEL